MKTDKQLIIDNFNKPNYTDGYDFKYKLDGCKLNGFLNVTPIFIQCKINTQITDYVSSARDILFFENTIGLPNINTNINDKKNIILFGVKVGIGLIAVYKYIINPEDIENREQIKLLFNLHTHLTDITSISMKQFYGKYFFAFGDKIKMYDITGSEVMPADGFDAVPEAKYLEVYKNYLFAAGDSNQPNQVYFSKIGDGTDWTGNNGEYENFFAVDNEDNDKIVGLKAYQGRLFIFKEKSIYELSGFSTSSFILKKVADIGALNNEAIKVVKTNLFFISSDLKLYSMAGGFRDLSTGRQEIETRFNGENVSLISDNRFIYFKVLNQVEGFAYDTEFDIFTGIIKDISYIQNVTINNALMQLYIGKHEIGFCISDKEQNNIAREFWEEYNIIMNIGDVYADRLKSTNMSVSLITTFTNDNSVKLLKWFYLNAYRKVSGNTLMLTLHNGDDNVDKYDIYDINDVNEIDNIYRIKPIQITKSCDIWLSVGDIKDINMGIEINKIGFFYNIRRIKRGVI